MDEDRHEIEKLYINVYKDNNEYSFNIFGEGLNVSFECKDLELSINDKEIDLNSYGIY